MGTAFLILLLLALCGFIAYIGDLLGRRLGKKRLSVFGLRPKHTAILLTIVTGVLIAGVTFAAALVSVPMFREVVTKGERLAGTNRRLVAQNGALERQNAEATRRNTDLSAEKTALQQESQQLKLTNADLTGKNADLNRKNSALAGQNQALQAQNKGLQAANERLRPANLRLTSANTRLTQDNAKLQRQRSGLEQRMTSTRAELQTARAEVGRLRAESQDLKEGNYVFRRNQQMAQRRVIPANPPREVLRETVKGLLYEVERPRADTTWRVELVPPPGFNGNQRDRDAIQNWAIDRALEIRNKPLVISLVAEENSVEGRPIRARLGLYTNEQVFRKGQIIAQTRIDGTAPLAEIFQQLLRLLQTDVRNTVLAPPYSMIPAEDTVGELPYDRLFDVCGAVQKSRGPAVVAARARQDTNRAGPLNVDLEVSPVDVSRAGDR